MFRQISHLESALKNYVKNQALLEASVTNEFHLCVCVKMNLFQQNGLGNILRPLPRKWTTTCQCKTVPHVLAISKCYMT